MTLYELVSGALHRLDDELAEVYSRNEVAIYIKDGYDQVCRRTKCLFDIAYVENLPAVGNYSSDEEFEMAKQIPGLILTGKRNFTREVDRSIAPPGSVGPASVSSYAQLPLLDLIPGVESKANPVGQLPRGYVDIERVTHDGVTLFPEFSYGVQRGIDNQYESQGGSPSWFVVDKDGVFTLRRYPTGDGAAVYDDIEGYWGVDVTPTPVRVVASEPVVWTNLGSVSVNGNSIDAVYNGVPWSSNATSVGRIDPPDYGFVEYTVSSLASYTFFGLGTVSGPISYWADIGYSIYTYPSTNHVLVYESGVFQGVFAAYQVGDVLRVGVEGGVVKMRINGAEFYSSAILPVYPLFVNVSMGIPGEAHNAMMGGTLAGPVDPYLDIGDAGGFGSGFHPDEFPSGGPWGIPTRFNPDTNNTRVELSRLGQDLGSCPMELPRGYAKYIEFWACSRALKRDGPGQDLKLSKHYADRFEVGIARMTKRLHSVNSEYVGYMGHGSQGTGFRPNITLPWNYGRRIRRSGRY